MAGKRAEAMRSGAAFMPGACEHGDGGAELLPLHRKSQDPYSTCVTEGHGEVGSDARVNVNGVRTVPKGIPRLFLEKNNKQHDHHQQGEHGLAKQIADRKR
jgi:hypothetical protein